MSDLKTVIRDIPFGAVFAYRVGDKVTADAVKANGWEEYVAGSDTKSAQAAVAKATSEKES